MDDSETNAGWEPIRPMGRPTSVTVFGVLNIVIGLYLLVRFIHSWYRMITGIVKNPEGMITLEGILILLLGVVGIGLAVWLIVLGWGLLKMKRWARRGSVIYAWIMIIFMVITLGGIFISTITDMENAPRILRGSVNISNALGVIRWIYMILLLIFMQTSKVKQAFAAVGG